jgi:glutamate racemase
MSTGRFIIEGEWSGYRSGPQRIVHRTVHKAAFKRLREWAENTKAIYYTDGTCLRLSVRDCQPRERVQEIHGYDELILGCAHYGVASVDDLRKAKEAAKVKL